MPSYSVPYVHSGDPAYAPPVLRAPSPTSSIGTDYGPDEPVGDENFLLDSAFARNCLERLRLNDARAVEQIACYDPLLPKCNNAEEEKLMHLRVMQYLRSRVQALEADALFEQTVIRGTVITEERKPSSDNIDHILQSMMGTSITPPAATTPAPSFAPLPTPSTPLSIGEDLLGGRPMLDFPSPSSTGGFVFPTPAADSSTPAANRRITRNMGKTRR